MFFVYNRSKISDLFILQFVYFASWKQLFYFLLFNLFYKLWPHSVHINKINCISKINYKDTQTRIINNVVKKCLGPAILSLKGQSMVPCPVYIIKWYNLEHGTSANSADFTSFNMWPKQPMVTACFFHGWPQPFIKLRWFFWVLTTYILVEKYTEVHTFLWWPASITLHTLCVPVGKGSDEKVQAHELVHL